MPFCPNKKIIKLLTEIVFYFNVKQLCIEHMNGQVIKLENIPYLIEYYAHLLILLQTTLPSQS